MAGSRDTNTMAEGCRALLNQITKMKIEPDADMDFLTQLETGIIGYLKPPVPPMPGQGGPEASSLNPAMASVMGAPMMGGPMMGGPGPGSPNPDELRRMLGQ